MRMDIKDKVIYYTEQIKLMRKAADNLERELHDIWLNCDYEF